MRKDSSGRHTGRTYIIEITVRTGIDGFGGGYTAIPADCCMPLMKVSPFHRTTPQSLRAGRKSACMQSGRHNHWCNLFSGNRLDTIQQGPVDSMCLPRVR